MQQAARYCREGNGPALVHAHCTRPYSHSLSDDEKLYKTPGRARRRSPTRPARALSRAADRTRYPRPSCARPYDPGDRQTGPRRRPRSARAGASAPRPPRSLHLYSEKVDPTSAAFDTEPQFSGEQRTMVDLINDTLHEEMRRDERIVVFGEDVADCSREATSARGQGQGRSFQGHRGTADRIRLQALLQFAHRRSRHRGPRHRHGDGRPEARLRDSVLRLHLAGDDADSRRDGDSALALATAASRRRW